MGALDGQVVVITGTSRGIGRAIGERCLEAGALVLGVSRHEVPGLTRRRGYAHSTLDVTAAASSEIVLQTAIDAFGRVDALVNNAGVLIPGNCWEYPDGAWNKSVAVNLKAPFMLSERFARHWVSASAKGVILNMCSLESEIAWKSPPQVGYAATKGALLGLTRAMALDFAAHGIRVVAIGPGVIETGVSGMAAPLGEAMRQSIPLGRLGTPEEVGDLAVFLLSERAAYVTGEIVFADGGYRLL
jgi:NAD(P)-dependent dehydrogenase (short-subunit alcohol dehydrogenase family)